MPLFTTLPNALGHLNSLFRGDNWAKCSTVMHPVGLLVACFPWWIGLLFGQRFGGHYFSADAQVTFMICLTGQVMALKILAGGNSMRYVHYARYDHALVMLCTVHIVHCFAHSNLINAQSSENKKNLIFFTFSVRRQRLGGRGGEVWDYLHSTERETNIVGTGGGREAASQAVPLLHLTAVQNDSWRLPRRHHGRADVAAAFQVQQHFIPPLSLSIPLIFFAAFK